MRRKGRTAALLTVFAMAVMTAASGCGGGSGKGTLRVGVRDDIMNFGYLNETTGKYYGLEIDIAAEMTDRMGYSDVEYITVTPDTRKDMLLAGYRAARSEAQEYETIRQNVDALLSAPEEQEQQRRHELE